MEFTKPIILSEIKTEVEITVFSPVYQGPRWVRIMKNGGRISRDTLPLKTFLT